MYGKLDTLTAHVTSLCPPPAFAYIGHIYIYTSDSGDKDDWNDAKDAAAGRKPITAMINRFEECRLTWRLA